MARLLITGASGLLGANLVLQALEEHQVIAITNVHSLHHPRIDHHSADLSVPGTAQEIVKQLSPDWIVHCAAATNVDWCERHPSEAMLLNRDMAGWVAQGAAEIQARFIHISTDAVFDGEKGSYMEQDLANPINVYGKTKLEAELVVLENYPHSLVLRTNMYGWNAQDKLGLAEWFLHKIRAAESCIGFLDVMISPMYIRDLSEVLMDLLETDLDGILHVPAQECVSKFSFSQRIAAEFGLDGSVVTPGTVDEVSLEAPRPRNLCLKGKVFERELGVQLPAINDSLHRFREDEENGYRRRLKDLVMLDGG
jgi:dTDP-4-dehydrorhamnose reductase